MNPVAATILKTSLYLLGGLLTAPGALLAYFLWTVTGAASQKDLLHLLAFLFERALDTLIWATWFLLPGVLIWLVLAFVPKYRFIGAIGMALVAITSLIGCFAVTGLPKSADDLSVPIISFAGLLINAWLIYDAMTATATP